MYGKTIKLTWGDQTIEVFVMGTPDLSESEWKRRAKALLHNFN